MKTLIKLKIERFEENAQEYFVATSDELQRLVAEGEAIEETIEIAEDIAHILLDLDRKNKGADVRPKAMPSNFEYPLIVEV